MKKNRILMIGAAIVLLVPVLALVGCAAANPASASEYTAIKIGSQQEGIWVTGIGEVKAVPDVAVVSLGVQAQAPTVAEAQDQARRAMDSVIATLKANGVADEDIQTTGFSIWQRTRWDSNRQEEEVVGYQVSNNVQVKIRQVGEAGIILDEVVEAGGDLIRVQGIYFQIDDTSAYLNEAREKAVADAKAKAEQLANLSGVTLGRATYVSENTSTPVIYRGMDMAHPEAGDMPAPTTPIEPGETTITATVQIIYHIS